MVKQSARGQQSNFFKAAIKRLSANFKKAVAVAQEVERWTRDPEVPGSKPTGTLELLHLPLIRELEASLTTSSKDFKQNSSS